MHFPIWGIKNDKPNLYYIDVDKASIDLTHFRKDSEVQVSKHIARLATLFYYLDDILGGHRQKSMAWQQFYHTESILEPLSLQTKAAKARETSQTQEWLGKIYDTVNQCVRLPIDKVNKYVSDLKSVLTKKTVTKRELLRHIGRTRHIASIYKCPSAFARNLEVWACSVKHPDQHIRVSRPLKNDIEFCIWGIQHCTRDGTSVKTFLKPYDKPDIVFETDASGKVGIGGISNKAHWFQNKWSDINFYNSNNRDILWKELVAIYSIMATMKNKLSGKCIHIKTDNEPVKYMLISMRSKLTRADLQIIINKICKMCIQYRIH